MVLVYICLLFLHAPSTESIFLGRETDYNRLFPEKSMVTRGLVNFKGVKVASKSRPSTAMNVNLVVVRRTHVKAQPIRVILLKKK